MQCLRCVMYIFVEELHGNVIYYAEKQDQVAWPLGDRISLLKVSCYTVLA